MNNLIELINGIILIVKNFLRKIKDQKYNKLYPINPKHDDVYIVEFTILLTFIIDNQLVM